MPTGSKTVEQILAQCREATLYPEGTVTGVNQRDVFGDTPLHLTSRWGDVGAVEVLIAAGADVNAIGEKGQTPVFAAANLDVAHALVNGGANLSIRDDDDYIPDEYLRIVQKKDIADFLKTRKSRH